MIASPNKPLETLDGPWAQSIEWTFRLLFFLVIAIAAGWMFSGIRRVPADSQAVVFRFGRVVNIQGPGLLLAWPVPVDRIYVVPAAVRQIQFNVPRLDGKDAAAAFDAAANEDFVNPGMKSDPRQNTAFMLTGDSNVVRIQATLVYQITDPVSYIISRHHIAPALERLFIASVVAVVANRDLDAILVARPELASRPAELAQREQLRNDLVRVTNQRLDDLAQRQSSIGIHVSRVDLVASIPDGAKEAFDHVLFVTQDVQKNIAQARTQAELQTQLANQQRAAILVDATARAQEQVTRAKTQTATVVALAGQDIGSATHEMLMSRLYFERVGTLLKKVAHVQTVEGNGLPVILSGVDKP
jgi:regulator of protease activity HflC (stomatin/prohibitin superfamily)